MLKDKKPGYGYRKGRGALSGAFKTVTDDGVKNVGRWRSVGNKDPMKANGGDMVVSSPAYVVDIKDIDVPLPARVKGAVIKASAPVESRGRKPFTAKVTTAVVRESVEPANTPNETTIRAMQESEILFKMLSALNG